MKKLFSQVFIVILLLTAGVVSFDYATAAPAPAGGTTQTTGLNTNLLKETGLNETLGGGEEADIVDFIGQAMTYILGFLGVVFVILTIWAGAQWMTAGGEEEKVKKAKQTLRNSIIGVIIIICSYAITSFVFNIIGGFLDGSGGEAHASDPTGLPTTGTGAQSIK